MFLVNAITNLFDSGNSFFINLANALTVKYLAVDVSDVVISYLLKNYIILKINLILFFENLLYQVTRLPGNTR